MMPSDGPYGSEHQPGDPRQGEKRLHRSEPVPGVCDEEMVTVSSSSLAEGIQQLASPGNDGSACLQSKTGHGVQMPAGGGREVGTACSPGLGPGQSGSMRSRGHLEAVAVGSSFR